MFSVQLMISRRCLMPPRTVLWPLTTPGKREFFNSNMVKKIEESIDELHKEVSVVLTVCEVSKLQTESKSKIPELCGQLRVTPYFVGREAELDKLKSILDSHGCGAIMHLPKNQGWIPGGCYLVGAHGNCEQFIASCLNRCGEK